MSATDTSERLLLKLHGQRTQLGNVCRANAEDVYQLAMARVDLYVLEQTLESTRKAMAQAQATLDAAQGDLADEKTAHAATVDNWSLDIEGAARRSAEVHAELVNLRALLRTAEDEVVALKTANADKLASVELARREVLAAEKATTTARAERDEARNELAALKATARIAGPSPVPPAEPAKPATPPPAPMRTDDRRNEKCPHGWPVVWVLAEAAEIPAGSVGGTAPWVRWSAPECRSDTCAGNRMLAIGPAPTVRR